MAYSIHWNILEVEDKMITKIFIALLILFTKMKKIQVKFNTKNNIKESSTNNYHLKIIVRKKIHKKVMSKSRLSEETQQKNSS